MEDSNRPVQADNEYSRLIKNIGATINKGKLDVYTQTNQIVVFTYWNVGKYIVEYEQAGHEKAEYGSETLNMLSKDLTNQYGAGFSRSNISRMRQLYLAYPKCATLSHKLSWSHQLMTDDIRHKLYDLKNCDINFAENEIFTSERIKLLRDIIDRQIDAVFRPFWHYTPMGVQCG